MSVFFLLDSIDFSRGNASFFISHYMKSALFPTGIPVVILHKFLVNSDAVYSFEKPRRLVEKRKVMDGKVEKTLKGSLDSIPSPSHSVKIQIIGGKVCLSCKGLTLLGIVNKLFKTKSFLTSPSNVLLYYLM